LVGVAILVFICLNGILGLFESQMSQEQVRNAVFNLCLGNTRALVETMFEGARKRDLLNWLDGEDQQNQTVSENATLVRAHHETSRGTQYIISKITAATFSIGALFLTILAPAAFILAVIIFEIYLSSYPASEGSDAIGAWSEPLLSHPSFFPLRCPTSLRQFWLTG